MKDGLKWIILIFVAALLVLLVVTQKDKFMKDQAVNDSVNVNIAEIKQVEQEPIEEVGEESEEVEVQAGVRLDEQGVRIAP